MGYRIGMGIVGVPVFVGCWLYCVAHYGFLLGVAVGWFPSLIVAVIAGALWPVFALAALWLAIHH